MKKLDTSNREDRITILRKIIRHFKKQGAFALNNGSSTCSYRTADGRKCAVGCLIPDRLYDPAIEGKGVQYDLVDMMLRKAGIVDRSSFLTEMQRIHDGYARHEPFSNMIARYERILKEESDESTTNPL